MNRRIWTVGAALLCALAWGCDDESAESMTPAVELPDDPDPDYTDGHWSKVQRGVALDRHDVAVIRPTGEDVGLTPDRIEAGFARVVLNQLLVEFIQCPNPDEAAMFSPLAKSSAALDELGNSGVEPSEVAINVAILDPNGKELLHICLQRGAPKARFDVPEHRENTIAAFQDLAGLGRGLKYITVGVELNRYFHLEDPPDSGQTLQDDYSNLATLYRDVYAAIKAVDSSINVGPGLSWAFFRKRTVEQMVTEYGLTDEEGELSADAELEAIVRGYKRTIAPFLRDPNGGGATADYIGLSVVPFTSQAPFEGSPGADNPEADEDTFEPIAAYYRHMRYVSDVSGLPIVLPRVDWPTPTKLSAGNKSVFLRNLKRAVSHVDIEWAAWRRTSDLPQVALSDTCAQEQGLGHPIEFCFAGMLDENGDFSERGVLDNLLTDP